MKFPEKKVSIIGDQVLSAKKIDHLNILMINTLSIINMSHVFFAINNMGTHFMPHRIVSLHIFSCQCGIVGIESKRFLCVEGDPIAFQNYLLLEEVPEHECDEHLINERLGLVFCWDDTELCFTGWPSHMPFTYTKIVNGELWLWRRERIIVYNVVNKEKTKIGDKITIKPPDGDPFFKDIIGDDHESVLTLGDLYLASILPEQNSCKRAKPSQ